MGCFPTFLTAHLLATALVGGYVFLAAVNAMTAPGVEGGGLYGWLYRFLTALTPAIKALEQRRGVQVPQPPTPPPGAVQVIETASKTVTGPPEDVKQGG